MTKMSLELELEAVRLSKDGHASREVARLLGCSKSAVGNVLVRQAVRRRAPKEWNPSPARLSMAERMDSWSTSGSTRRTPPPPPPDSAHPGTPGGAGKPADVARTLPASTGSTRASPPPYP
jgi:hypothetical protein